MGNAKQRVDNSHSAIENGWHGPTIISRIEKQMDKRRKALEDLIIQHGSQLIGVDAKYQLERGRYEGFAAALSLLRGSSVGEEVSRSNERLGID